MKVCIYFSLENILIFLSFIVALMILFDVFSEIKNTIEIKAKFYIKYNHNYNIENNSITWITSIEEINYKSARDYILVHLTTFNESIFLEKNINLKDKKSLKENSHIIGEIFSEDRLINFISSSKFKNFLKNQNIDYEEFKNYFDSLNSKSFDTNEKTNKIMEFIKENSKREEE